MGGSTSPRATATGFRSTGGASGGLRLRGRPDLRRVGRKTGRRLLKIGFIGLGKMGAPMCGWLLEAGYPLVVFDLRRQAAAALVDRGAVWADSPARVAEQCDFVATCVPGPAEMEDAALGPGGIVEGARPGTICIDHTTNSPHVVRRVGAALAERKAQLLDAPVDGGMEGALAGSMTLFAGGDERALERARPVLESYCGSIIWTGGLGTGTATKIAHNALAMSIDLLVTECLTLGVRAGVELPRLIEAFRSGCAVGGNAMFNERLPVTLFRGDFSPRFALRLALKDYGLATALASEHGVPTRIVELCAAELAEAMDRGWGERDRTIASVLQEERANVRLRLDRTDR